MTKKELHEIRSKAGKAGANKVHATRYQTLIELSKYFAKDRQNDFLTWPTKHLETLLEGIESKRTEGSLYPNKDSRKPVFGKSVK